MPASETISIKVEHLSKQYHIGIDQSRETFREALTRMFSAPFRRSLRANAAEKESFWALKDVSFEVSKGEVLGIIGRNGAGKSTLLKILSRITEPSQGRVEIRGRVASLLEVGTGFHGELTGRENIYLNGAILGMSRAEISRKFDDIVGFAEVEKFINTPVKHYSSGMYVRLAFAVAAYLDQDILFVDEVLAVGDAEFQKRCLSKMHDISRAGRTVLFVSHNAMAIRDLCSTGLLLENGTLVKRGAIDDVLTTYIGSISQVSTKIAMSQNDRSGVNASVVRIFVVPVAGVLGDAISGTAPFSISVEVEVVVAGEIGVILNCYNDQQQMVFSTASFFEEALNGLRLDVGTHLFECEIPGHILTDGIYVLDVELIRNRMTKVVIPSVVSFRIVDDFTKVEGWSYRPGGILRPKTAWRWKAGVGARPKNRQEGLIVRQGAK